MNYFGKKFEELYFDGKFNDIFEEESFFLNSRIFYVLKFKPNLTLINHCLDIAKEKSKYTMVYNQNLEERTEDEKLVNAFRGILAETLVHLFLLDYCNLDFGIVKRFDLERADFHYSKNEYDINIIKGEEELRLECRSSSSWTNSIKKACETKPIIGQYVNSTKSKESISDLYSSVLFQYDKEFCKNNDIVSNKKSLKDNTVEDIINNNLIVYLPSGTDKVQMTGKDSKVTNYGQKNTKYTTVLISKARDIKTYVKKIEKMLKEETA